MFKVGTGDWHLEAELLWSLTKDPRELRSVSLLFVKEREVCTILVKPFLSLRLYKEEVRNSAGMP